MVMASEVVMVAVVVVVVGKARYSGSDIHRGVADRWSSDVAGSGKLRLHGDRQRTRQLSVYGPTSGLEILLNFICAVLPVPLLLLHSPAPLSLSDPRLCPHSTGTSTAFLSFTPFLRRFSFFFFYFRHFLAAFTRPTKETTTSFPPFPS